ncbi:zeta toxin family protein [Nonomuraea sp. GTA35]|uniref:zeta toxin family protein n=1 Tax=Nonomuraea sp. GTA35 TaxID=1676746 RepID=UPI0035C18E53
MGTPTGWSVLGLADDPAPGDPGQVRLLADRLLEQARLAEDNTAKLNTVAGDSTALRMRGDYATTYAEALSSLPGELAKLGKAYRGAGYALRTYARGLDGAKAQAGAALRQGGDASDRYEGALREVWARLPAAAGMRRLTEVEAAVRSADAAVAASIRPALERARTAESDRARARRVADEAARLRGDAETRAVEEIEQALAGSGIQDKSWLAQVWDTISTPFRSWDDFVNLARNVAMVAGIALLVVGTGGLAGAILMGAVVVAGAIVFADSLNKYRQGKAGLGQVILDGIGMFPGGKSAGLLAHAAGALAGLGVAAKTVRAGLGRLVGRGRGKAPLTDAQFAEHTKAVASKVKEAEAQGKATNVRHTRDPQGRIWTAERRALHNKIIDDYFAEAADVPNERKAIMAGGLGGAGKSTVLENHAGIDRSQYLTINPDDIKEILAARGAIPEVSGLSPMEASGLVHEESSHVAKQIAGRALEEGKNVLWDITMASPPSVESRVDALRAAGYRQVDAVFVDIPVEMSVARAEERYRAGMEAYRNGEGHGGRYLSPDVIRSNADPEWGSVNRATFEGLKDRFDGWSVYDNSRHGEPPRLDSSGRGRRP